MSASLKITCFVAALVLIMPISVLMLPAAEDASLGKQVYESKCAMCHGKEGKGDTKAGKMIQTPDLTQVPWKHGTSQAEVEKILLEGVGKMKGYKDKLKAEEITAAARYFRELTGIDKKK